MGVPNPKESEVVFDVSGLLFGSDPMVDIGTELVRKSYKLRVKGSDNQEYFAEIRQFRNPWLREFYESMKQAELKQSIFRVRPIQNQDRRILILSHYPIDGIVPDELVSANDLLGKLPRGQLLVKDLVTMVLDQLGFVYQNLLFSFLTPSTKGVPKCQFCINIYNTFLAPRYAISERTIKRYYQAIIQELGLKSQQVTISSKDGPPRNILVSGPDKHYVEKFFQHGAICNH